jgi:tryptophan synthase alpha chain
MSRLSDTLATLRSRGEKAAGLFLTNGFPHPSDTLDVLHAVDRGGADFIELGMPFSDPLAEGLPIQRSSARALSHGVKMADAFETAEQFRAESDTPVVLMGYINPLLRYGVEAFCRDAAQSGVDGLILPDVPPEESGLIQEAAAGAGLDLIFLIAPNSSDERIQRIDELATGFVYAVSVTGLTGSTIDGRPGVQDYLQRARALVQQNPLLVGFGIKSHDDAMRMSQHTDGFIVGSALIEHVEQLWDDGALDAAARIDGVERFVHTLTRGSAVAGEASETTSTTVP